MHSCSPKSTAKLDGIERKQNIWCHPTTQSEGILSKQATITTYQQKELNRSYPARMDGRVSCKVEHLLDFEEQSTRRRRRQEMWVPRAPCSEWGKHTPAAPKKQQLQGLTILENNAPFLGLESKSVPPSIISLLGNDFSFLGSIMAPINHSNFSTAMQPINPRNPTAGHNRTSKNPESPRHCNNLNNRHLFAPG
jgi:hypothetical protein